MKIKKTALIPLIALVFIAVTLSAVTAGVLIAQQNVPNSGSVGGNITSTIDIKLYNDPDATIICTAIDWGNLNSGDTATKTIYIKNTGNVSETLSMTTTNWTPSTATQNLSFTWTQEGTLLAAGEVVPATIVLKIASDTSDLPDFSFNMIISGTAQ
jgi:archaellum component FlaG (FlaF/FlaG flagellin family)